MNEYCVCLEHIEQHTGRELVCPDGLYEFTELRYFADNMRHVWCEGGRSALLVMADDLGIPHHWYHASPGNRLAHIDIPVRQKHRVLNDPRVTIISPRDMVRLMKEAR